MEILVEAKALPEGALSLLVGSAGDLLEHLGPQDVVAFTGSSETGATIRSMPAVIAPLGARQRRGRQPERRRARPRRRRRRRDLRLLREGRAARHDAEGRPEVHGHPPRPRARRPRRPRCATTSSTGCARSSSATPRTTTCAWARSPPRRSSRTCARASTSSRATAGSSSAARDVQAGGRARRARASSSRRCCSRSSRGADAPRVHAHEVFGPVATLVPYYGHGGGRGGARRRAATAASSRPSTPTTPPSPPSVVLGLAPYHGRVFLGSAKIAEASPGPGTVLPLLVHGGPGRAGGGEELGGLRGLALLHAARRPRGQPPA